MQTLDGSKNPKTEYVPAPDTQSWYSKKEGCGRGVDPTEIMRRYTFPDAMLPIGIPMNPAASSKVCLTYHDTRPLEVVDSSAMMDAARNHPQFAFSPRGPAASQIDVESQLRRLDQRLSKMQAVIADDAPLFRNTVQPPQPYGVRADVLNAANPISTVIRPGESECRDAADAFALSKSGRRFNNFTRQDTQVYAVTTGSSKN